MTASPTDNSASRHARLRRLCEQMVDDQLAGAMLELSNWCKHDDAPPEARTLFAACLAQQGKRQQAIDLLEHDERLATHGDPRERQLLIALLTAADQPVRAARHVDKLAAQHGHEPATRQWLGATAMPGAAKAGDVPHPAVVTLADDLYHHTAIIPSLTAAQRAQADPYEIDMLRQAVARVVERINNDDAALLLITSLAQLALLAHDADDARYWARRGLSQHPYLAPLALVLAELPAEAAEHSDTPSAAQALANVRQRHPEYADVRAALIRRHHVDGNDDEARLEIARWLEAEPGHPLPTQLQREIAA